jgi:hypothetical protein
MPHPLPLLERNIAFDSRHCNGGGPRQDGPTVASESMRDALRLETKLPVTQTVNVRIGRENSLTVRLGRSVWEDSLHPSGKTAFAGTSGKTQTAGKTAFVQFARGRGRQDDQPDKTALAPQPRQPWLPAPCQVPKQTAFVQSRCRIRASKPDGLRSQGMRSQNHKTVFGCFSVAFFGCFSVAGATCPPPERKPARPNRRMAPCTVGTGKPEQARPSRTGNACPAAGTPTNYPRARKAAETVRPPSGGKKLHRPRDGQD